MKKLVVLAVGLIVLGTFGGVGVVFAQEIEGAPSPSWLGVGVMTYDGFSLRIQPKPWFILEGDMSISGWVEGLDMYPVIKMFVLWDEPIYFGGGIAPVISLVPVYVYEEFCDEYGCWMEEKPERWQWQIPDVYLGLLGMLQLEITPKITITAELGLIYSTTQYFWGTIAQVGVHSWIPLK